MLSEDWEDWGEQDRCHSWYLGTHMLETGKKKPTKQTKINVRTSYDQERYVVT